MILSYIYVCQREMAFVYRFFIVQYRTHMQHTKQMEFCYLIEWDSILSIRIERAPKHFICPGNVIRIFKYTFLPRRSRGDWTAKESTEMCCFVSFTV